MAGNCNTRVVEAPALAFSTDALTIPAATANSYEPAVQVAGFDPNRRKVTVVVDADAPGSAYVVDSDSAPLARGVRVAPGAGLSITAAAAVYVRAAVAVTVYVVNETGSIG